MLVRKESNICMYTNFPGESGLLQSRARKANVTKLEWSQSLILVEVSSPSEDGRSTELSLWISLFYFQALFLLSKALCLSTRQYSVLH